MFNRRSLKPGKFLAVMFLLSAYSVANALAAGPAISTNSQVVNTILSGKSSPAISLGKNGDFYIDVQQMIFYGPKKNGLWPTGVDLKGSDGKNGVDGKNGSDGSTSKAIAGPKGDTGATGPAGPKGETGATGPTGPAGAKGDTGAMGATGATGPSRSFFGTVSFSNTLATSALSSTSSQAFGNFEASKSYLVRLTVIGSYGNSSDDLPFQLTITTTGGVSNASTSYSMANVKTYRNGTSGKEVDFSANILVDGSSSVTTHNLVVTITHDASAYGVITLSGSFVATQVGSTV